MLLDGEDVTALDAVAMAKLRVVQVPGGRGVFPTLTVAEHFTAAAWLLRDDPEVDQRREEVLDRFPRLRERFDQMAGNLSGGEQQQLALGMAFLARPELLIIDELSLGLAPTSSSSCSSWSARSTPAARRSCSSSSRSTSR